MNKILGFAFILIMAALIPSVSASECSKNVYYLTPEYVFADGNMVFKYIDMDLSRGGPQNILTARPGELVTVEVSWAWGSNCPDCTVYVNAFGSWDPGNDIMEMYSGPKGKVASVSKVPISFMTPDTPGIYKFRVVFAYDREYSADFDGSNLCSSSECQKRGECSVLIAEGNINVTTLSPSGTIPLFIEMTRPKTTAVSGILEADVGAVIPVDAVVNAPPNMTVNVTVKIDANEVSSLLPYSWNTFESSAGSHKISVVARDEMGNVVSDEITVLLLNRTGTYGTIPPLLWKQRINGLIKDVDISDKGAFIIAGSDRGFVYLFDKSDRKLWEYPLPSPINGVAFNSDAEKLLFASGNILYYLDRNGSLIWTYPGSMEIKSVAMDNAGNRIAFASGNVLYYLDSAGALLWTYSTSNQITGIEINADGDRIAAISGNVLYYLGGDGAMLWTHSSLAETKSVAMNDKGDRIAFTSGNVLYYMDDMASLLWNLTGITDVSISADGHFILATSGNALFAINKGGSLIWQDISKNPIGTVSVSADGRFLAYSEGESVFLRDNSQVTIPEQSKNWIYAVIILIILAAGILLKKNFILRKIGIKKGDAGREAPPPPPPVKVSTLKLRVVNYKTKRPIGKASVRIRDNIAMTDEHGNTLMKDVPVGERTVIVEREAYQPAQKSCVIGDDENFVEVTLVPAIRATGKNEETLKGAMYNLSREYEKVSMHDTCLPNYYRSVGERIVEFLEMLSYSPELIEAEDQKEFIDSFVEVGAITCDGLLEVITDWRNVKLYQAASELEKTECDAKSVEIEALHMVFANPDSLKREIESRLGALDSKMMDHMNKLTIIPVSTLWQVSKELFRESSSASGYRKLAMLFFANVLISYTNDMLENEEIVKRLKFALL